MKHKQSYESQQTYLNGKCVKYDLKLCFKHYKKKGTNIINEI